MDGDLSDPGWKGATKVDTWYETNPGDNVPPKVKSVGYLTYDDRFLYAGFEFFDPEPEKIRAPFGDRDNVPSYTDYGGIILDTHNDGRTAWLLLANPRGIQYDAITDDGGNGEDNSPDLFWEASAKITKEGWTLEIRVPFSTLRYPKVNPQLWRIMLYRNYPRAFRYQMFTSTLPRRQLLHLRTGPDRAREPAAGGHLVVAPYDRKQEGAAGRSRHAFQPAGGAEAAATQVDAQLHTALTADQPRFLAGRIRRRADRRQRASRLLPGEAPVLPGRDRAFLDSYPGRVHAEHHVSPLGPARHGEVRRQRLHGPDL
jgi:hypothetical protein